MNIFFRKLAFASGIGLVLFGTSFAANHSEEDTRKVADARHETQILTSFSRSRRLRAFDLIVSANGDKVVLGGSVEDAICKDLAERLALDADGIKIVENHIVVDPGYTSSSNKTNERSVSGKAEDATITASIKSKLLWNSSIDGLDIHVYTKGGKVTLSGHARSSMEKEQAGRIARDTDGVSDVRNEIKFGSELDANGKVHSPDESTAQAMSDTWITSKVKSSLLLTRGVDGFGIVVTTVDGVVFLHGVVDSIFERELAVRVSREVRGVKRVEAAGLTGG
ncbi:MAG: BON domain-containing protein [Rudaea sp.]